VSTSTTRMLVPGSVDQPLT
jgi:hypothetical protein